MNLKQQWNNVPFKPGRFPFFYGWVVLIAGTIGVLVSAPGQTMGVSVFTDHLLDAIGISRDNISLAYMVGTIGSSFALTWAGKMYDKYGARWTGILVSVIMGVILLFFSRADKIITLIAHPDEHIYSYVAVAVLILLFFALRFTGQGVLTMVSRNMMMKWFIRKRGLVNGISAVFISFGFAVAPLTFNSFIDVFSWRNSYIIMAVSIAVLFSIFVFLFYRDNPEDLDLEPDGSNPDKPAGDVIVKPFKQFTLKEARSTFTFWLFALPLAMHALYITGFTFHLTSIFEKSGLPDNMALEVFIPSSVISVALSLFGGYISDKIKLKYLLYLITAGQVIALFSLGFLDDGIFYYGFILGNGISGGLYSVLMAVTWPRFYGRKHLGQVSGFVMAIIVFASALGPVIFSFSLSQFGNYYYGFFTTMAVALLLFVMSFKAQNPQRKFRESIGEN